MQTDAKFDSVQAKRVLESWLPRELNDTSALRRAAYAAALAHIERLTTLPEDLAGLCERLDEHSDALMLNKGWPSTVDVMRKAAAALRAQHASMASAVREIDGLQQPTFGNQRNRLIETILAILARHGTPAPERDAQEVGDAFSMSPPGCRHEGWNFKEHGRVCHKCRTFMVDFGD